MKTSGKYRARYCSELIEREVELLIEFEDNEIVNFSVIDVDIDEIPDGSDLQEVESEFNWILGTAPNIDDVDLEEEEDEE